MAPPSDGPTRDVHWKDIAWLMISDVVGTSVLTFAGVAHQLGYVLTVLFILGLFPASLYVSVLMARTRGLLAATARLRGEPEPPLGTMGEVTLQVFGTQSSSITVYAMVYGYTLLGQASYLLAMGTSAQGMVLPSQLCITPAVGLSIAGLLLPVVIVRRLNDSITLCRINSLLALVVVVVAIWAIVASDERCAGVQPYAFHPELSLPQALGSATNVLYAYAGQWMYYELMDTMAEPGDFPKAFMVTGPFMVGLYLAVAMAGTFFGVVEGDIVMGMPRGRAMQAACIMLFVHVVIVYLIKSIVLARYLHSMTSPEDLEAKNKTAHAKHAGWGIAMLVFSFFVANAIPFFSELMGLIGGLCAGPINFIFPIYLYLVAADANLECTEEAARLAKEIETNDTGELREVREAGEEFDRLDGPTVYGSVESERSSHSSSSACSVDSPAALQRACRALRRLRCWEAALILAIVTFTLATMVIGVSDVIGTIIAKTGSYGAPFSCHLLPEPSIDKSTCKPPR